MSNLLQTGTAWMAARLKASASEVVTYRRGTSTVLLSATRGKTAYERMAPDGRVELSTAIDWLFTPDDLILDSAKVLPERGDRIETATEAYEVVMLDDRRCYELAAQGELLRVHTQRVLA